MSASVAFWRSYFWVIRAYLARFILLGEGYLSSLSQQPKFFGFLDGLCAPLHIQFHEYVGGVGFYGV